jgi:hypothetical protein
MSSLLNTASPWINENDNNNKKRIPTMKKTKKTEDTMWDGDNTNRNIENMTDYEPNDVVATINNNNDNNQQQRISKVNELLNKITNIQIENDGNKLLDFTPITNPVLTKTPPSSNDLGKNSLNNYSDLLPSNNLQQKPVVFKKPSTITGENYTSNNSGNDFSNYNTSYELPKNKPYYSNMGIGGSQDDNKIIEKINYMIHLLEENQNEKTNNISEEFILYTFVGVFIIYIVDSFSRVGKYTR